MAFRQDFPATPSNTAKLADELEADPGVTTPRGVEYRPRTNMTRIHWRVQPPAAEQTAAAAVVAAHTATPMKQGAAFLRVRSPNRTLWRITIDNAGSLQTAVEPP